MAQYDVPWGDVKQYVLDSLTEYDNLVKDPNFKKIVEERQAAIVKDITERFEANLVLEVAETLLEDMGVRWDPTFGTRFEGEFFGENPGNYPGPDIHDNPLGHPYWYEIKTKSGKEFKDVDVGKFTMVKASPEFLAMDEQSQKYWGGMYKMAYKMRNLLLVYATNEPKWPTKSRVGIKIASLFTQLKLDKVAERLKEGKVVTVDMKMVNDPRDGLLYKYTITVNVGSKEKMLDIRSLYHSEFKFVDNFDAIESIRKAFFAALTRLGFTYTSGKWEKYV